MCCLIFLAGCASGGRSERGPGAGDPKVQAAARAIAQPPGSPTADLDIVVAVVNGKPLTHGEIYRRVLRRFGTAKLLSDLITEELVAQEAEKRGVKVPPEEIDDKVNDEMASQMAKVGGKEALEAGFAKVGLTLDDVRRSLAVEAASQLLLRNLVKSMRTIDEAALSSYYKSSYAQTRYRLRHIAYSFAPPTGAADGDKARLKLEAYNRAVRAAEKVRKGGDFAAIARAESDETLSASRGGELGAIPNDPAVARPFMRPVFSMKENEVSEPLENPDGAYHVFQVTAILPGESFLDCKDKIVRELQEREPNLEEVQNVLLGLRRSADVQLKAADAAEVPAQGAGRS